MMAKENNTLHLVLKRKWWDMIASGEKREEYRDVCHYWAARLLDSGYSWYSRNTDYPHDYVGWLCLKLAQKSIAFKNYENVCFHLGYTNTTMTYLVEDICIIHGSACNKEWGAEESKHYFVIKLGERIE